MTLLPVTKTSIVGSSSENSGAGLDLAALVDWIAEDVEDASEGRLADGDGDRRAGVLDVHPTRKTVRRVHRHRADAIVPEMLLHLRDQLDRGPTVLLGEVDAQRVKDLRELLVEDRIDDDAPDLDDFPDVLVRLAFSQKSSPVAYPPVYPRAFAESAAV